MEEEMLSLREAEKILGLSKTRIAYLIRRGRLPGAVKQDTKIGSYWAIPRSTVETFHALPRGRPSNVDIVRNFLERVKNGETENAGQNS